MKRLFSLIFTICLMISLGITAYAVGDGNIDSGGGEMGEGNLQSYWDVWQEGVRVTVVRAKDHAIVTVPVDLLNVPPLTNIHHFGKVSKISYNKGQSLKLIKGGYTCVKPTIKIPTVVSDNGNNNIEQLKKYFCSEYFIKLISNLTGMNYDVLISGDYKILVEPLAYFKILGEDIVTTATEAALYDQKLDGKLRHWMGTLTHKNLPLSMFLEVSDLGYPSWNGSTNAFQTNQNILSSLGIGVVRFEKEPEPPKIQTYDYEYRTNTDVITSVWVSGGQSDPDNPVIVKFKIDGKTYNIGNVYYPKGDSQLAWVKWTTPDKPQDIVIQVTASSGQTSVSTIKVKIVDLNLNPPPNPVADDKNDSFNQQSVPTRAVKTSTSWNIWKPIWKTNWVWISTGGSSGYWVDNGLWDFTLNKYYASLTSSMDLKNDRNNPTATSNTLKSGYGVNIDVSARISTNQSSAVSKTPNAVSYFPEFNYKTYWRLLERIKTGTSSELSFKRNIYSTYNDRTHFTPIWMPDGEYKVNTWVIDYWTPSGMLSMNLTDSLNIKGNLWDDWHIAPKDNK